MDNRNNRNNVIGRNCDVTATRGGNYNSNGKLNIVNDDATCIYLFLLLGCCLSPIFCWIGLCYYSCCVSYSLLPNQTKAFKWLQCCSCCYCIIIIVVGVVVYFEKIHNYHDLK